MHQAAGKGKSWPKRDLFLYVVGFRGMGVR